jgi:hypothetical protein
MCYSRKNQNDCKLKMMNRKKTVCFLLLNMMISVVIYGQQKTNNADFYSYWKQNNEKKITENSYKSHFGKQAENHIDSLISIGIDTIGAYTEAFPGYKSNDECDAGSNSPWVTYVQWEKNGKAFQKEFTQSCRFKEKKIGIAMIIRYYINASLKIKKETLYPVITKIYRSNNGKIKNYDTSYIDHCACYSIYCLIKRDAILKRFDEYQINEKTNVFYKQNMESAINSWRNMIDNQVKKDS